MQQPEYDESEGEMMEDFRKPGAATCDSILFKGEEVRRCFGNWMAYNQNCLSCYCRTDCKKNTPDKALMYVKKYAVCNDKVINIQGCILMPGGVIINKDEKKEMTAVGYIKEQARMCNTYKTCEGCPISKANDGDDGCKRWIRNHPEEAVAIVQQWSEEHPEKTMLRDFLEKYPKAPKGPEGLPCTCPWTVGYGNKKGCPMHSDNTTLTCEECWNRIMEVE